MRNIYEYALNNVDAASYVRIRYLGVEWLMSIIRFILVQIDTLGEHGTDC